MEDISMNKKILAAITAVLISMTAAGCGNTDSSSAEKETKETTAEVTTAETTAAEESKPEETTTTTTAAVTSAPETTTTAEPEPEPAADTRFDYYADIVKAMDGRKPVQWWNYDDGTSEYFLSDDGKKLFFSPSTEPNINWDFVGGNDSINDNTMYVHDIEKNETKVLVPGRLSYNVAMYCYCNGKIYLIGDVINIYDESGKLLHSLDVMGNYKFRPSQYKTRVLDNGMIALTDSATSDKSYILSADLSTITEVSYEKPGEHGKTDTVTDFATTNKGLAYWDSDNNIPLNIYDAETNEWTETPVKLESKSFFGTIYIYGNYVYFWNGGTLTGDVRDMYGKYSRTGIEMSMYKIYDLTTGELVTEHGTNYPSGNDYNIEYDEDQQSWVRVRYPDLRAGGNPEYENMGKQPSPSVQYELNTRLNSIDGEKYLVVDKYGVFIRTFEKGDAEEITALEFIR